MFLPPRAQDNQRQIGSPQVTAPADLSPAQVHDAAEEKQRRQPPAAGDAVEGFEFPLRPSANCIR